MKFNILIGNNWHGNDATFHSTITTTLMEELMQIFQQDIISSDTMIEYIEKGPMIFAGDYIELLEKDATYATDFLGEDLEAKLLKICNSLLFSNELTHILLWDMDTNRLRLYEISRIEDLHTTRELDLETHKILTAKTD